MGTVVHVLVRLRQTWASTMPTPEQRAMPLPPFANTAVMPQSGEGVSGAHRVRADTSPVTAVVQGQDDGLQVVEVSGS